MFDTIKRLGTETATYGVSTILGRFLNFLLVPFYTNLLPPGDYGVVAYLFSLIAFANVVYGYGMESAYFRFAATGEVGTPRENYSTPFISLFLTSSVFSGLILVAAPSIAQGIALPPHLSHTVEYAGWILFFDALAVIPFASLRLERKAKQFAILKFVNIVINVGGNILLVMVMRMGVEGIFLSNLFASAMTFFLLMPAVKEKLSSDFSPGLYRALLKFGLPYVPAGLATMMIQVVDRPILRFLTDDATVGVYQANYRLGIFMMLVVQMYDYAWRPFFMLQAKDPNAKELYARILTYFLLFMALVFLVLTFFIPDIVRISIFGRHIIHPDYWGALGIVPIVLFAYMFLGISNNMVAGIYIEKRTHYLPAITFVGAGINIAANFILIPRIGAHGAAWATLFSYAAMAVMLYIMVQRVYPVRYEWARMAKIALAGGGAAAAYFLVPVPSLEFLWKLGLVAAFTGMLYFMKFFQPVELVALRNLVTARGQETEPPEYREIVP